MEHYGDFELEIIMKEQASEVADFLRSNQLTFESDIEYTAVIKVKGTIAATGSFAGNVLKCIAVLEEYQGYGLAAKIVSELIAAQFQRGRNHLFLYTKPSNRKTFGGLGFYEIETVAGQAILMENKSDGIQKYVEALQPFRQAGVNVGGIVMNCNPFTLGHQHLIEYAAAKCDILHVFIVWEDRSVFPNEVRYRLVKEGTGHLKNIVIHKATHYIISNATFPSYFLKTEHEAVEVHAKLDLGIFIRYIAPALGINRRFVGEEPFCRTTAIYNDTMRQMLPSGNITVEQIERFAVAAQPVSASRVRALIKSGDMDQVQALVPEVTYRFLISPPGAEIIRQIQVG